VERLRKNLQGLTNRARLLGGKKKDASWVAYFYAVARSSKNQSRFDDSANLSKIIKVAN
jgi:hypothetical protein